MAKKNNNFWWWLNTWWDFFDKKDKFDENKRKFIKKLKERTREEFIPVTINFSSYWTTNIHKDRRVFISINDNIREGKKWWKKFAEKFIDDKNIEKIIWWYDKIPQKSDVIDSLTILFDTCKYPYLVSFYKWWDLNKDVNDYYNNIITYEQYRSKFDISKLTQKNIEVFAPSWNNYTWTWINNLVNVDKKRMEANIKLIRWKIKPVAKVNYEESFRTGKRINRWFMNWTSYKPLKAKLVENIVKKKLFVIIDCSGSMWEPDCDWNPAYEAISFAWACYNSWLFDMKHIILHSSEWWRNVESEFSKNKLVSFYWTAEWFEWLPDNLEREWVKSCDYVVVLTDLRIWSSAERWLYDYIKWMKHLILSFKNSWTINGMNVRTVKNNKDIINSLFTLVWR